MIMGSFVVELCAAILGGSKVDGEEAQQCNIYLCTIMLTAMRWIALGHACFVKGLFLC